MDDIWISRCLERRGVEKHFIPASNRMGIAFSSLATMTLHDVPSGGRHNNKTVESFRSRWNIFTSR